jgi:hypothetical protein
MTRHKVLAIFMALAIAACSPPSPTSLPSPSAADRASEVPPTPTLAPSPTADRDAGWRADLEGLIAAMDAIHPNLTHGTSREALDAAVTELAATIPTATDDELMVGVLRIVAMVSADGCDAHTGAFIWGTGTYPVDSLPLRLWLFGDEVVIVDALAPYQSLVGSRIDTLDGLSIAEVIGEVTPLIPRDNDQTVRLLLPRYLLVPQVLRGLGIAGDGDVTLGLTDAAGASQPIDVEPIPMAEYNAWAGPYGLHLPADPDVLYLSRIDEAAWWTRLPDADTLFVQWNRADHLPLGTTSGLRDALRQPDVVRVVLDLRHNYGGEVSAMEAMLDLFTDPAVDQPGRLYVITGRNTFSAASLFVARIDRDTEAAIVGEPMAGCPTAYGNSADATLPFSRIVVSVAGMLEIGASADDGRATIVPDIPAELTREEWANGSDPALGLITTVVP